MNIRFLPKLSVFWTDDTNFSFIITRDVNLRVVVFIAVKFFCLSNKPLRGKTDIPRAFFAAISA